MSDASFRDSTSDPGFLVAKGRFRPEVERERSEVFAKRDAMLRGGLSPASEEVIQLTNQIDSLNKKIDAERDALEKTHVKKLASAVVMSLNSHGYVNIRAVGRSATYNAVKAIAIASSRWQGSSPEPKWSISFNQGNLGSLRNKHHVQEVTAMLFHGESDDPRDD